jgi:hypothetical protein
MVFPTPAVPERVAPASRQSKWAGPRVKCTRNGAGNSAVSNLQNGPGVGDAEAVKPLGGRFTPQRGALGFWGVKSNLCLPPEGRLR